MNVSINRLATLVIFCLTIAANFALADTTWVAAGNISGTWTAAGSPYMIHQGDVTIPDGELLEIGPGVKVYFTGHYMFVVAGRLRAEGTEGDSILFTTDVAMNPLRWESVRFFHADEGSVMAYCIVEYGYAPFPGLHHYWAGGGGISILYSNPLIEHCCIRNNFSERTGGGIHVEFSDPTVRYCSVIDNEASYGVGIGITEYSSGTYEYCLIKGNHGDGPGHGMAVVGVWDSSTPRISNFTIVDNMDGAGAFAITESAPIIENSIAAGNHTRGIRFYSLEPGYLIRYNNFFGNTGGVYLGSRPPGFATTDHYNANGDPCDRYFNIFLDPDFVDPVLCDFHLLNTSPCIDAGNPATAPDPDGSTADMGAFPYEHVPGLCVTDYAVFNAVTDVAGSLCLGLCPDTSSFILVYNVPVGQYPVVATQLGCLDPCQDPCQPATYYEEIGTWLYAGNGLHRLELRGDGCICVTLEEILAVELSSFEALPGSGRVDLNWTTASERDNDYFEIVRDGTVAAQIDATNNPTGDSYSWTDQTVTNGRTYYYALFAVDASGYREELAGQSVMPAATEGMILEYALHQNFPNPFNPETTIVFDLAESGPATVKIYNAVGQTVTTLVDGQMNMGRHTIRFNATDLPSGLYLCRLTAGEFSANRKMILMK